MALQSNNPDAIVRYINDNRIQVVSSLPSNPSPGTVVVLTAVDGTVLPGVRGWTGSVWV